MNADTAAALPVLIKTDSFMPFGFILQQGFNVSFTPGFSLNETLAGQFGIRQSYIDSRIKTAFLNGKPVDDYSSAIVRNNDTLALSAAMPGLVGATFRSGGILSPFRSSISFRNIDAVINKTTRGGLTIKLFNLLVKEIGPGFLGYGIEISINDLKTILKFMNSQTQVLIDNQVYHSGSLDEITAQTAGLVCLTVELRSE